MTRRQLTACLLCLLPLSLPVGAPADEATLGDLHWMVGQWEASEGGTSTTEHWTGAEGGMMLGVHRDVLLSGRVDFEFLRIAETDDGVVYFASPGGRSPATPFRLIESDGRRAVFANPQHDFPKRLVYWLAEDGALHARAEGDDGEGPEWRWQKMVSGPAEAKPSAELIESLRATEIAFSKSVEDKDLARFRSFLDDSVVFFGGDTPHRGSQEVVDAWQGLFTDEAAPFSWAPAKVQVRGSDGLGVTTGPYHLSAPQPDGTRTPLAGTFFSVWKLQPDDSWKVIFDTGTPARPVTEGETPDE